MCWNAYLTNTTSSLCTMKPFRAYVTVQCYKIVRDQYEVGTLPISTHVTIWMCSTCRKAPSTTFGFIRGHINNIYAESITIASIRTCFKQTTNQKCTDTQNTPDCAHNLSTLIASIRMRNNVYPWLHIFMWATGRACYSSQTGCISHTLQRVPAQIKVCVERTNLKKPCLLYTLHIIENHIPGWQGFPPVHVLQCAMS